MAESDGRSQGRQGAGSVPVRFRAEGAYPFACALTRLCGELLPLRVSSRRTPPSSRPRRGTTSGSSQRKPCARRWSAHDRRTSSPRRCSDGETDADFFGTPERPKEAMRAVKGCGIQWQAGVTSKLAQDYRMPEARAAYELRRLPRINKPSCAIEELVPGRSVDHSRNRTLNSELWTSRWPL